MTTNVDKLLGQLNEAADKADDALRVLRDVIERAPLLAADVQRLVDRAEDVRERTTDLAEHVDKLHRAYGSVADEVNDGHDGDLSLDDLDADVVKDAQEYARLFTYTWPPTVGSYDAWWEANL